MHKTSLAKLFTRPVSNQSRRRTENPDPVGLVQPTNTRELAKMVDQWLHIEPSEEDHVVIGLLRPAHGPALRSLMARVKGVSEARIPDELPELRLRGPQAVRALKKLTVALQLLDAVGADDGNFLKVLEATPALMADALPPGVEFTVRNDRVCLEADVQWLQCVIVDLAHCAPSLACRLFLLMEPQAQWTLLTRYPSAFDALSMRIEAEADKELLRTHFEAGLKSEMDEMGDALRIVVWMTRCPSWAEASLHGIWLNHPGDSMKTWWLMASPALNDLLVRWGQRCRVLPELDDLGRPSEVGSGTSLARGEADAILKRVCGYSPDREREPAGEACYTRFQYKSGEDKGAASMGLPPAWQSTDILHVIEKVKGVRDAWISNGQLHAEGTRAESALTKLTWALLVLSVFRVSNEKDMLDVLSAAPALMADAMEQGVRFSVSNNRTSFDGDLQWLQCAIADLAYRFPSLACRLFLRVEPQAQRSLLTCYPSAFDTLLMRIEKEADRKSLQACFELGLTSDMNDEGDAQRIAVWLARCPSWAEASLHDIWIRRDDESRKRWLRACPALGEMAAQLAEALPLPTAVLLDEPGQRSKVRAQTLLTRYEPDAILERLRESTRPPAKGTKEWKATTVYISTQFEEVLSGQGDRVSLYGKAVESWRLLKAPRELLFFLAFSVLANRMLESRAHGGSQNHLNEAVDWLLEKLFGSFRGYFSSVASFSFARLVDSPLDNQLHLRWDGAWEYSAVAFVDEKSAAGSDSMHGSPTNVHLCLVLARMIKLCGAEDEFPFWLPLMEQEAASMLQLIKLVNSLKQGGSSKDECLRWLAPNGLKFAHWKIQFFWRLELLEGAGWVSGDDRTLSNVVASILKSVLTQHKDEIPKQDMDLISRWYVPGSMPPDVINRMLEQDPSDQRFRRLVVCLMVNDASDAYTFKDKRATELIALLCRSQVPTAEDFDLAATYMTARHATAREAILQLQMALRGAGDDRGWERVFLWASSLLRSRRPNQAKAVDEAVEYLAMAFDQHLFKHLGETELLKVREFLDNK